MRDSTCDELDRLLNINVFPYHIFLNRKKVSLALISEMSAIRPLGRRVDISAQAPM
jgi:hypothetical protein